MKLNDTIQAAIDGAKAGLKKLLGQERVSQFANKNPKKPQKKKQNQKK